MRVLADLEHHDGHAAVLADGQSLLGSDLVVADDLLERPAAERRLLAARCATSTSSGIW